MMKLILTTLAIACLFIVEESVNAAAASQSPDKLTPNSENFTY